MNSGNDIASVESKVTKVICSQLDIPHGTDILRMDVKKDLGANKEDMVAIIMLLERLFDLRLLDDRLNHLSNVGDIAQLIHREISSELIKP
ncbi:MAG: hypothetical protein JKY09_02875 [Crocinitomicaceae bacterium]|nr:hypothetical protein [Crocinitomicaceae bacterium]